MPIRTDAQRDELAQAYAANATHASAHTADPGAAGTVGEVVRAALTWGPGDAPGVVQGVASLLIPDGVQVTHGAVWDGTSFRDAGALPAPYTGPGVLTLTARYAQS